MQSGQLARRKLGLQSLPVAFGVDTAKWITVATIDVTQAAVAAYLFLGLNEPLYGAILTALILPQVWLETLGLLTAGSASKLLLHAGCANTPYPTRIRKVAL
jgi:4-hydroxybenzoate polyprenyltransferase